MVCETRPRRQQTAAERLAEVKATVEAIARALTTGRAKAVVDRSTGAVAFAGLLDSERNDVSDACTYRRIMAGSNALAKAAIAKAEALAGRSVSRTALTHGVHSHDGGKTFHHGH